MNKKVLSCALVAAMLASSVGAMNVFAEATPNFASYDEAFKNHVTETTATEVTMDKVIADLSKIDTAEYSSPEDVDWTKDYFLMDFAGSAKSATDQTVTDTDYTYADVVSAIEDAVAAGQNTSGDLYNTAVAVMAQYYANASASSGTWDGANSVSADKGNTYGSSAHEKAVQNFFDDYSTVKDINWDRYNSTEKIYYGLYSTQSDDKSLASAFKTAYGALDTAPTSTLVYLSFEYDRLLGTDGLVSPETSAADDYDALLEKVEALIEEDYTTTNWAKLQARVSIAEAYAADENYDKAAAILSSIFKDNDEGTAIETATPDYSELKSALAGLFDGGNIPSYTTILKSSGTFDASTTVDQIKTYYEQTGQSSSSAGTATYAKFDYDADEDLWNEFSGEGYNTDASSYVAGAYREAIRVYSLCARSSTRKYVAQSTVTNALNDLNEAILALDPNSTPSNWIIVRLEDALDKANAVIEDDYRTTSTYWKRFLTAKENVEKALEATNLTAEKAESTAKALEEAIANLNNNARKSVPSDTKTALKDAVKEANTLMKDTTGKTATQIKNLKDAVDAANKVTANNKALISEYEAATADVNTAITAYKQAQGWYKDANGTWYYGKEDTVAKGWLNVNGIWYLLDDTTGAMKTGWQQVNGTWYYMDASGAMKTGWLNLNGTYYYLESWGGMATGWKNVNGSWYYLQGSGAMVANGWYWINGKCYYFYNWGGMAANTTINGYKVDASGAWVK